MKIRNDTIQYKSKVKEVAELLNDKVREKGDYADHYNLRGSLDWSHREMRTLSGWHLVTGMREQYKMLEEANPHEIKRYLANPEKQTTGLRSFTYVTKLPLAAVAQVGSTYLESNTKPTLRSIKSFPEKISEYFTCRGGERPAHYASMKHFDTSSLGIPIVNDFYTGLIGRADEIHAKALEISKDIHASHPIFAEKTPKDGKFGWSPAIDHEKALMHYLGESQRIEDVKEVANGLEDLCFVYEDIMREMMQGIIHF
jgi:hypothetical protein